MPARSSRSFVAIALVATLLTYPTAPRTAGLARVYQWTDAGGVRHYGDRPPPAGGKTAAARQVRVIPVAVDASPIAGLHTRNIAQGVQAVVDNLIDGPIEVSVGLGDSVNVRSEPSLPATAVVPARGSAVLASIVSRDPTSGSQLQLTLDAIPGDPRARAQDVEYLLPLKGAPLRIDQNFGGSFSHNDDQNRFALDFAAPVGTLVQAARDGVVMQVESDFSRAGLNRERDGGRANLLRILHDDGSMAVYAHIRAGGVLVRAGQRVRAGQPIALTGNTGFSTGPHLHFAVQVNRGMHLESIRFRMRGPDGPMRLQGNP